MEYKYADRTGNGSQYDLNHVEKEKNDLNGKTIIFLGSSVTLGYGSCDVSFVDYLKQKDGIKAIKEAVSGTTLVTKDELSYIPRMKTIDKNMKADAFICQLSTNDAFKNLDLGNLDSRDESTITGGVRTIIEYARNTWHCPVYFYTSPHYDSYNYEKMVNRLYELKTIYSIGIIDLWKAMDVHYLGDKRNLYLIDDIHPTKAGYLNLFVPEFEKQLLKDFQKGKKIYFAGSIRGGRADAELYGRLIAYMQKDNDVLTEHIGNLDLSVLERGRNKDTLIYQQDTNWLKESDVLIAECTCPSLGVGYELAYAERFNKPCYIFYDRTKIQLSAMLTGDPYYHIYPYEKEEEIYPILDRILKNEG